MVVDADDGLALDGLELLGHQFVLLPLKGHAIALGFPIWRVHVKQGVGTVVAVDAGGPVELLDVRPSSHAQVGCREVLLNAQQVDGWGRGGRAEALAMDLAPKGLLLQVKESGRPLDVGEGFRSGVRTHN